MESDIKRQHSLALLPWPSASQTPHYFTHSLEDKKQGRENFESQKNEISGEILIAGWKER